MSLIEILSFFGIPTAITTLIIFIFKKYYGTKIENTFQRSMESYKQELIVATENAKFDFQRKIQDFNLFTTKKHEVYGELNKLLVIAEGNILNLYGLRTELSYEEYNKNDLTNLMEKEGFPEGKMNEIIKLFEVGDKYKAILLMKHFLRIKEFRDANNVLITARNFFWASIFYFSNEVEEKIKIIFEKLAALLIRQEQIFHAPDTAHDLKNKLGTESIKLKEEIPHLIEEVMAQMKQELSVGYYHKNK